MKVRGLVIHNTASAFGDAAQVNEWHIARGFARIGYHAVILNGLRYGGKRATGYSEALDGKIEPGRDESQVGAHCLAEGMNVVSLGVSCVGLPGKAVPGATPAPDPVRQPGKQAYLTERQYHALIHWLSVKCLKYGLDPLGKFVHPATGVSHFVISQHSDADPHKKPDCASLNLPIVRQAVATRMAAMRAAAAAAE
jgi:hypothetical protein